MLVKQWLQEYLSYESTSPQARARIRYSRFNNLESWGVFSIAGALPAFLQLALTCFLVALCLFVYHFHFGLFCCITAAVVTWFAFYAFLIVAPLFSSRCPYKSPSLKSTTKSIRRTIHRLLRRAIQASRPWIQALVSLEFGALHDETDIRIQYEHDEEIWTQADELFSDDRLVKDTIHLCLTEVDGKSVVSCVQGIVERRKPKPEPANLIEFGQDSIALTLISTLMREMRKQVLETESLTWEPWMGDAYILLLESWPHCSDEIGKNHIADFVLAIIRQDWSISEHILRWNPPVSLSVLSFALMNRNQRLCEYIELPRGTIY